MEKLWIVKLLKFYEDEPIKDSDNNTLQIWALFFCTTANSAANPIFQPLKSLQEEDIILNYSNDILLDKIGEFFILLSVNDSVLSSLS